MNHRWFYSSNFYKFDTGRMSDGRYNVTANWVLASYSPLAMSTRSCWTLRLQVLTASAATLLASSMSPAYMACIAQSCAIECAIAVCKWLLTTQYVGTCARYIWQVWWLRHGNMWISGFGNFGDVGADLALGLCLRYCHNGTGKCRFMCTLVTTTLIRQSSRGRTCQ